MKKLLFLPCILFAVGAAQAAGVDQPASAPGAAAAPSKISREDLKAALEANPDLVIDALRARRKEVLEILNQAVGEERQEARRKAEEEAEKEMADRVSNPYKPEIDGKTRVRGNKKAKYTLVEYSDFQCPYCARGFTIVEDLMKKYGDSLRFIFKNKPLDMHPEAMPAALHLEAAALQSPEKAWLFHDKLFRNQAKLGAAYYEEAAKELGLDFERMKKDAESQAVKDKVKADMDEAGKFGFDGTPGFLLNGVPVRGAYPVETFDKIVGLLDAKAKGGPVPSAPKKDKDAAGDREGAPKK